MFAPASLVLSVLALACGAVYVAHRKQVAGAALRVADARRRTTERARARAAVHEALREKATPSAPAASPISEPPRARRRPAPRPAPARSLSGPTASPS